MTDIQTITSIHQFPPVPPQVQRTGSYNYSSSLNPVQIYTTQRAKTGSNFQYLLTKTWPTFPNFSPRRRGPGRGLGGLYSIECPRIGGKKTISLKRFFPPTRAPAGLLKICFSRSLSREARRTSRQTEQLRAKQNLRRQKPGSRVASVDLDLDGPRYAKVGR